MRPPVTGKGGRGEAKEVASGLPCCLQFSGSTRVHTNTSTFSRPSNHLAQLSERWAHQNIGREVADRGSGAV